MRHDDEDTDRFRIRAGSRPRVVAIDDPMEVTSPIDMLEREPGDEEREIVRRLRRDSDNPMEFLAEALAKLTTEVRRIKVDHKSGSRDRANAERQLEQLLSKQPTSELQASLTATNVRVDRLDGRSRFGDKIIWMVSMAAIGGLAAVANIIWNESAREVKLNYTIQTLSDKVERLEKDMNYHHDNVKQTDR